MTTKIYNKLMKIMFKWTKWKINLPKIMNKWPKTSIKIFNTIKNT